MKCRGITRGMERRISRGEPPPDRRRYRGRGRARAGRPGGGTRDDGYPLGGGGAGIARPQRPDAVLLDVRMPTMNGIEVLRRIRTIDQALPVIIITGLATPSEIAKARELGVTEVIEKSYVLRNFSESLARATNRRPPSS